MWKIPPRQQNMQLSNEICMTLITIWIVTRVHIYEFRAGIWKLLLIIIRYYWRSGVPYQWNYSITSNVKIAHVEPSGDRFNIKMASYQYRKSHCESFDPLISTMGFPILVRCHLNTESGSWWTWGELCFVVITYMNIVQLSCEFHWTILMMSQHSLRFNRHMIAPGYIKLRRIFLGEIVGIQKTFHAIKIIISIFWSSSDIM